MSTCTRPHVLSGDTQSTNRVWVDHGYMSRYRHSNRSISGTPMGLMTLLLLLLLWSERLFDVFAVDQYCWRSYMKLRRRPVKDNSLDITESLRVLKLSSGRTSCRHIRYCSINFNGFTKRIFSTGTEYGMTVVFLDCYFMADSWNCFFHGCRGSRLCQFQWNKCNFNITYLFASLWTMGIVPRMAKKHEYSNCHNVHFRNK